MDVSLEGVRVERDGRAVLDIPSLQFQKKRTTAILGPNGSGKTTLLRLVAGLERPRTGRILIGGSPIPPAPRVAYVFQEQVFLRASVRENVELGLRLRGIEKSLRRMRTEDAASRLGIAHLMDRQADRLSGGERRRVSLARALCLQSPLVLLDEPLEGLDERTYSRLLAELPEVLAAFDATTLLVTHTRHEALRLAQDLVILVDGRVHAAGDTREVVSAPSSTEVAQVLGYTVVHANGRRVAIPPGGLKPGPGDLDFTMVVDDVVNLIEHWEVGGRIDGIRARLELPLTGEPPKRGDRVSVHAERFFRV
jgi:ABC-type sugar transport system ATPase subunit